MKCPFCKKYMIRNEPDIAPVFYKCTNHNNVLVLIGHSLPHNTLYLAKDGVELTEYKGEISYVTYNKTDHLDAKGGKNFYWFKGYDYSTSATTRVYFPGLVLNISPDKFDEHYERLKKLVAFS